MASYMQPRANLGGVARQPFRPGQWQGFKGVSKNTTYIQNNFYGSSVFGANSNYGYIQQGCNQCNGDSGMPTWMQWLVGIGTGASILGGILNLFKPDKPEGGGETPVQQPTQAPVEQPTQAPTTAPVDKPTEAPTEGGGGDFSGLTDLKSMVCRDASGKTQNISGDFAIKEPGTDGSAPKTFTITDNSSGSPHEYTYELTGTTSDGKPIYTCKSMNGKAASTENAYTLEMNGADGKPELVQYEDQSNYGSGLHFGTKSTKTPAKTPASTPTAAPTGNKLSATVDVTLSPGKGRVTVTADTQEELDAKVAKAKAESAKWETTTTPSAIDTPWASYAKKSTPVPQEVQNWNKAHPNQQISVSTVGGKTTYTTTAKIQTKFGVQQHKVSGSSIDELGKQIAELKKKAAASDARSVGGYAALGGAMRNSMTPKT